MKKDPSFWWAFFNIRKVNAPPFHESAPGAAAAELSFQFGTIKLQFDISHEIEIDIKTIGSAGCL